MSLVLTRKTPLIPVVVDLFFPFIGKRHKHTQDGANQRIYFPANRGRCPSDAKAMVTYLVSLDKYPTVLLSVCGALSQQEPA